MRGAELNEVLRRASVQHPQITIQAAPGRNSRAVGVVGNADVDGDTENSELVGNELEEFR